MRAGSEGRSARRRGECECGGETGVLGQLGSAVSVAKVLGADVARLAVE